MGKRVTGEKKGLIRDVASRYPHLTIARIAYTCGVSPATVHKYAGDILRAAEDAFSIKVDGKSKKLTRRY